MKLVGRKRRWNILRSQVRHQGLFLWTLRLLGKLRRV